jgi:hypothetical protein
MRRVDQVGGEIYGAPLKPLDRFNFSYKRLSALEVRCYFPKVDV